MSSQDVYGRKYWSVTIYQARLLFFLTPEYEKLREVKRNAESSGQLSLKKVNWEKLHVLGLLEVDRERRDWVYVRRGPLWHRFWEELGVDPACNGVDLADKIAEIDAAFDNSAKQALPFGTPALGLAS